MTCKCECHDELIYCSMCMESHEKEWVWNKGKTIRARFKQAGRCCMPRDDCSPCDLVQDHKGMHKHGLFFYDDTGVVF